MSWEDAYIEDSISWVCPCCKRLNRTPADDMDCRYCGEVHDSSNFDWETSDEQLMQIIDDMLEDLG